MRRAPVLHEGRPRIPAEPAIQLLQVAPAGAARGDRVAFFPGLGEEAHGVLGSLAPAVGAAEARERPARAAQVARQSPLAVFQEVGEGRGCSAARADPEVPPSATEVGAAEREVALEGRTET